ncbi:ShlB/FhaC/HecB family hemolysin secretion/activation protein [Vibrio sp. S17_S38]|uniref:ShlB/FhaC/HecB family hemolysin secretion/activation protein n=1 Tax=Vibrio sp. S17_S38 TaxID=2720229 RepID=UPI00167FE728|nr:ShlB/FhaC/HecB family hemolysin secretion/activation protein [Vibrio sp. S17_S38]MBD1572244.1 ShlB/FhaC/HecB family hemolysin secretion/activation protein [Vibrio sp. S17_S38]
MAVSFFSTLSYALPIINPSIKDELQQQQAERLKQIEQSQQQLQHLTPLPQLPDDNVATEETQCFEIHSISFQGNQAISSNTLHQQVAEYEGQCQCLGLSGINRILHDISNFYIQKGYVTSRALLIPQDLSDGSLMIQVLEGKLEDILLNRQSHWFGSAFPYSINRILNLRDIEQGLDQINRLARYNATIELLPGTKPGYTILNIKTMDNGWLHGSLGFNNGGQKNTGETQLSANASLDDALGLLDNWSVSGSKSSEFSNYYDSQNARLAVSIPNGYRTFSYSYSYSDYLNTVSSNNFSFESTGNTSTHDAALDWMLFRDDKQKISTKAGLNYRQDKNYIDDAFLSGSSRNLAAAALSLDYSSKLGQGFLTISPRYVRGISLFNSESGKGEYDFLPSAEFDKGEFTLSYRRGLIVPNLSFSTTFFGQWTNDTLYGNQRLSIGGDYSVRGFKEQSLSGDSGYYWRNDLTYYWGSLPWLGGISSVLAIDTGSIHPDQYDPYEKGHLTGTSLALSSSKQHYSTSLSVGFPIDAPRWLNPDSYVVNYSISVYF